MNRLIIFIIAIVALVACEKKSAPCMRVITCNKLYIYPVFVGFDTSEIDSVIFSKYTADSSFSSLVSQSIYTTLDSLDNLGANVSGPPYYKYVFDTLVITSGYDYQIYFPKASKTYRVYNITDTGETATVSCRWPGDCVKGITNMTISGGTYTYVYNNIHVSYILFQK